MTDNIIYRTLHTPQEFKQVQQLHISIWGDSLEGIISTRIMNATSHNGGVMIGAEDKDQLIGFCFALPGKRDNDWFLWSQITGVSAKYRGQGIGFHLKQEQRKWALVHDYSTIRWTFDPMRRGNAHFNMRLLATTSNIYRVNIYGKMDDAINAGMQSDRFEAVWNLQDKRVIALAEGNDPVPLTTDYPQDAFLLRVDGDKLLTQPPAGNSQWYFVEIPYNFPQLKQDGIDKAKRWQLSLRNTLLSAFVAGYVAVDFVRQDNRCWYVLQKQG
jgi:predicted GNAT superfamily acetyltransferase